MEGIFSFLGVNSPVLPEQKSLQRRVNSSPKFEMPATIRMHLAKKYLQPLRELGTLLGGHASRWAAEAEGMIEV